MEQHTELSDYQKAVEKNYRHNFIVNAMDGATFWFGYSFIAPLIIMPLYVSHFTDNPVIIGLIPFLSTATFLLPQLFMANVIERAPVKKFFPVTLGFWLERVPVFLLVPTTLLLAKSNPTLALIVFFILFAWNHAGAGLIIVGWQDMIAKIIPVDRRGRFFGITNFAGNASGVLGALAVPVVLSRFEFPYGFALAFGAASVLTLISWFFIRQTREPALPSTKPRVSQTVYFRSLPKIIRSNRNFSRYLIFQIVYAFSGMAAGFLVVHSARNWNLSDSQAGGYIIAMQIGQAVSNLLFGFLADRKGHKISLEMAVLFSALSFGLAVIAPNPLWFYLVFLLRGATFAGAMISGMAIVMEFSAPEDRPTYIGLANTIPGVVSAIAPLLGGWLALYFGYPPLFIISTIFGVASLVILRWFVREPRFATQEPVSAPFTGQAAS
jgi:MFS family permease